MPSPSAGILECKKVKSATTSTFPPSICHEVMEPNAKIFECCFKSAFHSPLSLSSRSSLVSLHFLTLEWHHLLIWGYWYFSWQTCSQLVIHPACHFTWCTLYTSVYKLNKQGDNIQLWHTAFPIWNQSIVSFPVLTVASWPVYRFLRRQVRWFGIPISLRIFHGLLWSTESQNQRSNCQHPLDHRKS